MHAASHLKSRQRGLTMTGFMFVAIVLVMLAMLAMKLVPAYIEFYSVKGVLASMEQSSDLRSQSNVDIRRDFSKRATTAYVTVVKPQDLVIDRSSGVPVVSAEYEFRTKLFGNISLVVDFSASTSGDIKSSQIE